MEYWLSSVSLNCRNTSEITNEKQFYTEDLSLELIRDNPDLVMLADSRRGAQAGLDLFVSEPRVWMADGIQLTDRRPGLHYLCFRVASTDAAHRDLIRKGVECTFKPIETKFYEWATYRDPSGVDIAISATPWPGWGDGFRDTRAPPHSLHATT